jgi:hypothetical protein
MTANKTQQSDEFADTINLDYITQLLLDKTGDAPAPGAGFNRRRPRPAPAS